MIDYGDFTLKFDTKGITGLYEWIDENFKCIKKGQSPHPDADILHEWIEGKDIEAKHTNSEWILCSESSFILGDIKYRIKPQEVYEWQWLLINDGEGNNALSDYFTQEGFDDMCFLLEYKEVIRLEQTKRVRNA